MKRVAFAASLLAFAAALPAAAQERIVVTGSRLAAQLGSSSSASYVIPHVGISRRADFLIRTVYVSCDTREAEARADELRRTLRGMVTAADRNGAIDLSRYVQIDPGVYNYDYGENVGDDTIVVPFTEEEIDGPLQEGFGGRSDTSYVGLLIKTPIAESDTLASATARIEAFVRQVDRVGRSVLDLDDADSLSVVDPQDYRDDIFTAMAADANERIAALGGSYGARFEGLENPVSWYRSDVLDLTLFIPHKLVIEPSGR